MPKYHTNPILLDHALSLSLKDLKRLGYLKEHHSVSGVVSWSRQGSNIASVTVAVDIAYGQSLEISYKSSGEEYRQSFKLIAKPSNLGMGRYWLIQSPASGRLGMKIYLTGAGFQIRADTSGCMYEKQIKSKRYRLLSMALGDAFGYEDLYSGLYRKGFKKTYAGKPTKRYKRLVGRINQAERLERNSLMDIFNGLKG
jgi:hypothetical protein